MLGGDGPLDFTEPAGNTRNYLFANHQGGFFVHNIFGTKYEVHSVFNPDRHGAKEIITLMLSAQDFMFSMTDCTELLTKVPDRNLGARWLAHRGHFERYGEMENWKPGQKAELMAFPLDRWALLCSTHARLAGDFIAQLQRSRVWDDPPPFTDNRDGAHELMLGAMWHLMGVGNVAKGVDLYNSYTLPRGRRPANIISGQPPVVDIGYAIVGLEEDGTKVMLCR